MEGLYPFTPILITLILSAFFSGIEIAFVSSNKLHIEVKSKQGGATSAALEEFLRKPSKFIATTLVGNNIALVLYGIYMTIALTSLNNHYGFIDPQNETLLLIIQTLVSTVVVLVLAEFTPKSIFLINPNAILNLLAVPFLIIYYLLYPVVYVLVNLSKLTIKYIFRLNYAEEKPVFGLSDLNMLVQGSTVTIEDDDEKNQEVDKKIFNNALEFKTIKVRDCMIPRTEITAVDEEDDIEELKKEFIESGHSKVLVYRKTIDDIIGYCHSTSLFRKPKDIASILNPVLITTETMLANELLIQLITERKSLALVVDEYGGTSGIVSIEDLIEEIFGEIHDEHDEEQWVENKIDEHTYILSARHEIDYLNEKYSWELPEGDYDTLGGLILNKTEYIPEPNENIEISPFIFNIVSIQENKINLVKVILAK